jgi:anti-sigma28 factor (negative regulator of flagellin synthesis)
MSDKQDTRDDTLDQAALGALLSASPDAINTKLELLKEALDNSTYTVNSKHIASKLFEGTTHENIPSTVSKEPEPA